MIRFLLILMVAAMPMLAAPAKDPAKLIAAVSKGLVQVEFTLQFDKGDAPHGILDQDPRSTGNRMNTLADLVSEERPLETSGFLVAADTVIAMDPCVHPRFIKTITVRYGTASTTAQVSAYAVDQWSMVLKLDRPILGTTPISFHGKLAETPVGVVNFYRQDGQLIRALLPFGGQFIETPEGSKHRVTEHQGVAVTADGKAVGLVMNHRLDAGDKWRGSPLSWKTIKADEFASRLHDLDSLSEKTLVRVRLSFRSPKATAGQMQGRFRNRSADEETDDNATERDAIGVVLPGGKVAVLMALKPAVTARLERVSIFAGGNSSVPAKFVASLRDLGALVVEPEKSLAASLQIDEAHPADLLGHMLLRAEIDLQGETRSSYFHLARVAGVRVGARLEPYPELSDPQIKDSFLFTPDMHLYALPVSRRERAFTGRDQFGGPKQLTTAKLLAQAVSGLPATADLANAPASEADENRLAWLGVEMQPLTRELARANNVADQTRDGQTGGLVTYVHPDSPAAKAGITAGMILLRIRTPAQPVPIEVQLEEDFARSQGFPWERLDEIRDQFFERIPTPWPPVENSFTRALTDLGFDTKYTAEFVNEGKPVIKEFEVVPGPAHYEAATRYKSESLGITVRNLTYDVRRYIQRKADEPGVIVSKIEAGGRASVAGVKPYELITHINEQPVASVADFEKLTAGNEDLKLTIKRMAKGRIVTIKALAGEKKE